MAELSNNDTINKTGNRALVIGGILVLLVLLAVAAFMFTSGGLVGGQPLDAKKASRNLNNFVLRPDDFETSYFQDGGSETPISNEEVILTMGQARGKQYITAAGRVDGWEITLLRSNDIDIAPQKYKNRIHIFESNDGAALAFSDEWFWAYTDETQMPDEFIDTNCNVGNECILFVYEDYKAASGLTVLQYDLAFRYRNVVVWVSATGLENVDITEADVFNAAQVILDKLESFE